ncbi:unnamed protein product [Triticum turgidum subsp. durum]|uniref:RNase H type-1 domain-containing protein n=1 Tax=Triticum turgidum subsp. durum TaxID=4567 RepID=A0A9R1ANW1_TRITD|nr:unnamed protein product [Triticum turgidum subsp. durum]
MTMDEHVVIPAPISAKRAPWPKPPLGWVALSTDGSFVKETGLAGSGMMLRDSVGEVIFSAYRYLFNCKDALEAEISAILEGMTMSIHRSELPIVIQSDNATVVVALTDDSLDRSAYGHLMLEIKKTLDSRGFIPLKIERHQNGVAHSLASIERSDGSTACWLRRVPDNVTNDVLVDCISVSKE